jgi:hypothetical protein
VKVPSEPAMIDLFAVAPETSPRPQPPASLEGEIPPPPASPLLFPPPPASRQPRTVKAARRADLMVVTHGPVLTIASGVLRERTSCALLAWR